MNNEIKEGLSLLRRLGNVIFWCLCACILLGSSVAGYYIGEDRQPRYYNVSCKISPNKIFKYYSNEYLSEYSDTQKDLSDKCFSELLPTVKLFISDDTSILKRSDISQIFSIEDGLDREAILYELIRRGYIIEGLNDYAYRQPSDKVQMTIDSPNYSVLGYFKRDYNLFSGLPYIILGLLSGLFIVAILYKVMVYIVDGRQFLKLK